MFISSAFAQTAPVAAAGVTCSLPDEYVAVDFDVCGAVLCDDPPQMKKQKDHKSMIDAVAKGDEVVTAGGVLGKISKLGDNYLGLEVANGVELQIQRSAVVQVLPKGSIK